MQQRDMADRRNGNEAANEQADEDLHEHASPRTAHATDELFASDRRVDDAAQRGHVGTKQRAING